MDLRPLLLSLALFLCTTPHIASSLAIYTDTLASGWADWSWGATISYASASPVHAGSAAISVQAAQWGALFLHHTPALGSGYSTLRFGRVVGVGWERVACGV